MTSFEEARDLNQAVKAAPYDPGLRAVYSDWLEEQGRDQEARHERWWSEVLQGRVEKGLAVITREGIVADGEEVAWGWRRTSVRRGPVIHAPNYWLKQAGAIFEDNPNVLFIVVSRKTPIQMGFRYTDDLDGSSYEARSRPFKLQSSPVVFYRKSGTSFLATRRCVRLATPADKKRVVKKSTGDDGFLPLFDRRA